MQENDEPRNQGIKLNIDNYQDLIDGNKSFQARIDRLAKAAGGLKPLKLSIGKMSYNLAEASKQTHNFTMMMSWRVGIDIASQSSHIHS